MDMRSRFFFSTLLSVVLGVALSLLALAISHANSQPVDLTENRRFTLAEQSQQAVQQLKEPVKVYAFVNEIDKKSSSAAEDLLNRYKKVAPDKLSFALEDPERNPILAQKFQVKIPGPAIVEVVQKDQDKGKTPRYERVNALTEDELTNALMKLNRAREMKLYALTGHGELSIDPSDKDGLSNFKADLAKEGFQLEELNLGKTPKLPEDCKVIMLAGPKTPLREQEKATLDEFVKNQGRLLLLLDPEERSAGYPEWVKQWGVDLPPEVIIDPNAARIRAQPIFALGLILDPEHPITKSLRVNLEFRLARPVLKIRDAPKGLELDQLAATDRALLLPAADVFKQTAVELPARPDMKSIPLAMAVSIPKDGPAPPPDPAKPDEQPPKPEARLVIVGDSDFVSNEFFAGSGNRDFALNTVNWLAETENQISIRPRDPKSEPLRIDQSDVLWMLFWHVLAIPFAILAMGGVSVWLRRR